MSGLGLRTIRPGEVLGQAPRGRRACDLPQSFGRKYANAALDYTVDFSVLAGEGCEDSLVTFAVIAQPAGPLALAVSNKTMDGLQAKFFLGGGVPGTNYLVSVSAVTALGRTLQGAGKLIIARESAPFNPAQPPAAAEDIVASNGEPITDGFGNPITTA